MNHCPVYQNIGGHPYGWVYPGPIGSVLTPAYLGLEKALDLPNAATMCNQCGVVCPVKIPLPDLMRKLRERQFERKLRPWSERAAIKLWAWAAAHPGVYGAGCQDRRASGQVAGRPRRHAPPPARGRLGVDRRARFPGAGGEDLPRALRRPAARLALNRSKTQSAKEAQDVTAAEAEA